MKVAVWRILPVSLLASLGAGLACGAALAADSYPPSMQFMPPPGATRLAPSSISRIQSPEALACEDASKSVSVDARIDACKNLIASGQWKGKEIAWAYANRCVALNAKGNHDQALADCSKAISLDPDNALAYQIRGDIMGGRDEIDKAIADYDKAEALGGKNAPLFGGRGALLLARGETDKAIADFDREVTLNGNSAAAYMDRGGAWLAKGDAAKAQADFAAAAKLSPNNDQALFNLGVSEVAGNDATKAIESFRQALKLNPANAYAALWLFVARGGDAGAKAELRADAMKATTGAWPWPVAKFYLGDKDVTQTLAGATSPGARCEAGFYIGQERLLKKARDEAIALLRKAVETCPKSFVETYRATAQLKELGAAGN